LRGGPRGFQPRFTCTVVLRYQPGRSKGFAYGALTLCSRPFQAARLPLDFVTPRTVCGTSKLTLQPRLRWARKQLTRNRFRLFPFRSPLLRESSFLSLPQGTEMCHFPCLALPALCVQAGVRAHYHAWVPPFGNPRINACSATPRGLSQPSTSFIAFWCQGIHRVPFVS
jgi:hypothetical protein